MGSKIFRNLCFFSVSGYTLFWTYPVLEFNIFPIVQKKVETHSLLVSKRENIKNDNKSLIAKPVTFSYYIEDFTKIKKEDDNSPLNRDETDEIEEANSDDFNNDDE